MPDDSVEGVSNQVRSAMGVVESALASLSQKLKSSVGPDGAFSLADRALGSMAKSMLGPIGVAAGFIGAAKAMESFAVSAVRLTDFARDTGFARERVVELQGALRLMGKGSQETISTVSNLGNTFQNLAVFKEGSDFWQSMSKFPGKGAEVATQIMKIAEAGMKVGDQTGAVKKFLEVFNAQDSGTKFAIAQALKESVSSLEQLGPALDEYIEKTKNLPPPLSPEKAQQFQKDMSLWGITIDRIWEHMAAQGIIVANDLSRDFERVGITSKTVAGALVSFVDEGGVVIRRTLNELNALITAYERLKVMQEGGEKGKKAAVETFGGQPFGSWFDFLNQTPGEVWNKLDKEEKDKTPGWGERMKGWFGNNKLRGGAGNDQLGSATDFSGRRRSRSLLNQTMDNVDNYLENYNEWGWHPTSTIPGSSVASWLHKQGMHGNPMRGQLRGVLGLNDPGETVPWEPGGEWHKNNSEVILRDIRDILERMENKQKSSGGGDTGTGYGADSGGTGGGYPAGQGRRGILEGRRYGVGQGSDPRGNRESIRAGAIKRGIDPNYAERVAASEGMNEPFAGGDRGTSFGSFQLHRGGPGSVGYEYEKATGHNLGDPKYEHEQNEFALDWINKYGWGAWSGARKQGITGRAGLDQDPATLAAREKQRAGTGQSWTSPYGWRKSTGSWHAGVDRSAPMGTPVRSAEGGEVLRSQWQSGYGRTVDVLGPDGVVRRYAHLNRMDVKVGDKLEGGTVVGLVGTSGTRSTGPHLHYEERPIEAYRQNPFGFAGTRNPSGADLSQIMGARKAMDQTAAGPDKWSGGINAKVEFLNVPGGVKTSADTDGDIFKQLQISRTKQGGIYNNPTGGYE